MRQLLLADLVSEPAQILDRRVRVRELLLLERLRRRDLLDLGLADLRREVLPLPGRLRRGRGERVDAVDRVVEAEELRIEAEQGDDLVNRLLCRLGADLLANDLSGVLDLAVAR